MLVQFEFLCQIWIQEICQIQISAYSQLQLNYNLLKVQQYGLIFLFMLYCRFFIYTIKKMRAFNGATFVRDGRDWNVKFSTLFRHGTTVWLFVAYLFRAYKYFSLRIPLGEQRSWSSRAPLNFIRATGLSSLVLVRKENDDVILVAAFLASPFGILEAY